MKTVRCIVVLFVLGVLLMFGLLGSLAEPVQVDFNVFYFVAIKAISFGAVFVAYKGIVLVFQVMKGEGQQA